MPNKIYTNPESAITWLASGGSAVLTLTSLAASAGRQGALHDLGASARSRRYIWRLWLKFATTPVLAEFLSVHLKTSDGTHPDNDDGTGDAAVSAINKLDNLHRIGSLIVDEASTTPEFVASGYIEVSARHVAPVIWNSTQDGLSSTAGDHGFSLTPVPDEVQ